MNFHTTLNFYLKEEHEIFVYCVSVCFCSCKIKAGIIEMIGIKIEMMNTNLILVLS